MMLFWILAITDLIMVGITWAVYGSSATYRDGMLLGVHLPESAISLSPVAQLTDNYQKHIRKFYLLHLVLGVVVAIPFFWLASIGITLWCIWFCVFLARAVSLLYSAHRQLYLLKLEQGLGNTTKEPFTVAADTRTAIHTQKAALPLYWHLLPLVMVFIPLFFSSVRNYIHADTTGLLFLVIWIAVWLLFLLIAWCYSKTGNQIYSAHSEINLAINMQEHRSWSWMFFFYSLCNSLAFISELIFLANDLEWYWWSHLLFFIFQTIPIVTIFVIYFRVKKKKAQILAADDAPIYVDDDYYWRNGWYNNPVDPRLIVPDRFCVTNFTTNMGRPAGKILTAGLAVVVAGLLIWMCGLFLRMDFVPVQMSIDGTQVSITSGYTDTSFSTDEILDLQLLDSLPDDSFVRSNGSADGHQLLGVFRGKKTGPCRMYVELDESPVLSIQTDEYTVFLTAPTKIQAENWYQELKDHMFDN